ncbi:hypothetical protein KY289_019972 [Solanum tuberosum]|nr:hypothetical protein KY289_019972 [Solanum tuberosum]
MDDRTVKKPIGVLQNVIVKVESFIFLAYFVILDYEVDFEVPIILGRLFLAIGRALADMERGQMKFRLNSEERGSDVSIEERLGVDAVVAVMMNFEGNGIEDYDELVAALDMFEFCSKPKKLELDMKNRDSPPAKPSVEEAPKLELKALPSHLRYVFLGRDGTLPVIIAADLREVQVEALVFVLKRFKMAIGWTIADIIGIPPDICSHKIQLMSDHKPSIKRLNLLMQEISIALEDQEKTTFSCPYGTFAFKRMTIGLCNALATFQRCMMSIFSDMVEDTIEIFMDDLSMVGDSFDGCLMYLAELPKRCEKCNIVLNWEKCHFMVKEGIVLGHRISEKGIEVDRAKVEVIEKLPPLISIKGVRSFLGHVDFYRRFIKDFSKIVHPLYKLLEKECKFDFDDACLRAFKELKAKIVSAPIIISPDWG